MLPPTLQKNDSKAKLLIYTVSLVVFTAVVLLSKFKINADLGFNVHLFAKANAIINSVVALLLLAGLATAKQKKFVLHKKIMLGAMILSILFLVSYICHHLLAGETRLAILTTMVF